MAAPQKTLLFEIAEPELDFQNPQLLRILLSKEFTRIDFGYTTPWYYQKGGWITIAPKTYLKVEGKEDRYPLKDAVGIAIAPQRVNFKSTEDWQFFSLYFEPLPLNNCTIHMIESEKPTPNDFNFYDIQLNLAKGIEIIG
jgi:hypothetical protein